MIIAIHQPTFLPWLGHFDKILRSDKFVILDDVKFQRDSKGAGMGNRVRILNNGQLKWLTVNINRKQRNLNYKNIEVINDFKEVLSRIENAYRKHLFFNDFFPVLRKTFNKKYKNITDLDMGLIYAVLDYLEMPDVKNKFIFQSDLKTVKRKTDLLVEICEKLSANRYLCGWGACLYQKDERFREKNIEIIHQNYKHPEYKQYEVEEFVSGLSIIDLVFNYGKNSRRFLIK